MSDLMVGAAIVAVVLLVLGISLVVTKRSSRTTSPSQPANPLRERLSGVLGSRLDSVWSRSSDLIWQELEEELIAADLGVNAGAQIVEAVRSARPADQAQAKSIIRNEMLRILSGADRRLRLEGTPSILVMVGVNGAGKTTTVAKLAARLTRQGRTPLIGAADTFRPAAGTQLMVWAERVGVQVVSGQAGGDPAAVAYDTLQAAKARGADIVIIDTAGRFHTEHNLMQELAKIIRVLGKDGDAVSEVLLVIDATTGQGGVPQARRFAGIGATGMILTKMDGTAKGGIVVAIEKELGLPVKFIGVGEGLDDLLAFDPPDFVDALLDPA